MEHVKRTRSTEALMARWNEAAGVALRTVEEDEDEEALDDDVHERDGPRRVFSEFLRSQREAVERALRTDPRAPMAL
eukprot:1671402-Prymnesium_polylepis.2